MSDEHPRSFARAVAVIADGTLEADASDELHKLVTDLQKEASLRHGPVKGALTLQLNLIVDPHGYVEIKPALKSKVADRHMSKGIMWITPGGNLTEKNPRQIELGLREVPQREPVFRDVEDDDDVREVGE